MTNPHKRLGVVELTVNGKLLDTVPGTVTIDIGGKRRVTQDGDQGANFSTKLVGSKVEGEVFFGPNTRLADYGNLEDCTVVARCDTGQTYTIANAWEASDDLKVKAGDGGKHKIMFCGPREARES